jgi:hypothetical protein
MSWLRCIYLTYVLAALHLLDFILGLRRICLTSCLWSALHLLDFISGLGTVYLRVSPLGGAPAKPNSEHSTIRDTTPLSSPTLLALLYFDESFMIYLLRGGQVIDT